MAQSATTDAPETAQPLPKAKKKGGRPPLGKGPEIPVSRQFFERVAQISADDWGTRAHIYLYRLEPFIDRNRSGNQVNIMKYAEPIDESKVMSDFGSGRYRAILTFRKPASQKGDELDRAEFEILNLKFPPKVPKGEWVDDPRNKKWAWERDAEAQAAAASPQTSAEQFADTLRAVNEIQDSAVARAHANTPAAADPVAMFKGFMDLMPKQTPSSENGMFTAVVTMMTGMMQQQGQIMQAQIAAANTREESLRTQMISMQKPGNGIGSLKEILGEVKEFLPSIKEFFPAGESRPRNMPWWAGTLERLAEGAAPVIPLIVQQVMANSNAQRQPQPQQNGARPQTLPGVAAPQSQPSTTTPAVQIDMDAMLLSALDSGRNGEDVADALNTMWGDDGRRLYTGLVQMGQAGIEQLIQSRPVWDRLGPHQSKIPEFVKQFIAWGKDEEPDATIPDSEVEVIG